MKILQTADQLKAFLQSTISQPVLRQRFLSEEVATGFTEQDLCSDTGEVPRWGFTRLSNDSRECQAITLFVALQGHRSHALDYVAMVLEKGVSLILADRPLTMGEQAKVQGLCTQRQSSCEVWVIPELASFLGELAHWFYAKPSEKLKVIGITGTNGKTSTSFYCAQMLESQQQKVAIVGTLGNGALGNLQTTQNTTPDAIRLASLMHDFVEQGFEWLVMEVSSHAIALGRIAGVRFYITALTQIGSDHLDFHGSEQHYAQTKLRLFQQFATQKCVLNLNDKVIAYNYHDIFCSESFSHNHQVDVWGYQVSNQVESQTENDAASLKHSAVAQDVAEHLSGHLLVQQLQLNPHGMQFELQAKIDNQAFSQTLQSGLMGEFNAENLACALGILLAAEFAPSRLLNQVAKLQAVPGRMQVVHQQPAVLIDFAHTADALKSLLVSVKAHLQTTDCVPFDECGQLYVVFGCGGDRDRQKRPQMARVAQQYADGVMVTSDNPRFEDPQAILDEICAGFAQPERMSVEVDRQKAIEQVLAQATSRDLVVIAGKGHEDYQDISGVKIPFSDAAVVKAFYQKSEIK